MSPRTQTAAPIEPFTYPEDVIEFARKQGILNCLEPLRLATRNTFPHGTLRIWFQPDAEREELDGIVYEVTVKVADEPDQMAAYRRWFQATNGIIPKPTKIIAPTLSLNRIR